MIWSLHLIIKLGFFHSQQREMCTFSMQLQLTSFNHEVSASLYWLKSEPNQKIFLLHYKYLHLFRQVQC